MVEEFIGAVYYTRLLGRYSRRSPADGWGCVLPLESGVMPTKPIPG